MHDNKRLNHGLVRVPFGTLNRDWCWWLLVAHSLETHLITNSHNKMGKLSTVDDQPVVY